MKRGKKEKKGRKKALFMYEDIWKWRARERERERESAKERETQKKNGTKQRERERKKAKKVGHSQQTTIRNTPITITYKLCGALEVLVAFDGTTCVDAD